MMDGYSAQLELAYARGYAAGWTDARTPHPLPSVPKRVQVEYGQRLPVIRRNEAVPFA